MRSLVLAICTALVALLVGVPALGAEAPTDVPMAVRYAFVNVEGDEHIERGMIRVSVTNFSEGAIATLTLRAKGVPALVVEGDGVGFDALGAGASDMAEKVYHLHKQMLGDADLDKLVWTVTFTDAGGTAREQTVQGEKEAAE